MAGCHGQNRILPIFPLRERGGEVQAFWPGSSVGTWCGLLRLGISSLCASLSGRCGLEETLDRGRSLDARSFAFFEEAGRQDDPVMAVKV